MIGVVVATHGHLAEEMIRTAEAVVGPLPHVVGVSVVATSPDMRGDLKAAIQRVDQGEGVLLLTDLLGGSPTNLCVSFLTERKVEVVTGVNLPMLLRAVTYRHESLDTLVSRAVVGGTQGVMQVAITAPQNQARRNHDQEKHDHQQ